MSIEFFIAKRIVRNKENGRNISSPAVSVAIASMALSLVVMILSVAIVVGFKKEVRNRVIGFSSHIQVANFKSASQYDFEPVAVSDSLLSALQNRPEIASVGKYATKPAMIKTVDNYLAIFIKGLDENFNWDFFNDNLIAGNVLDITPDSTNTDVLISKYMADKLELKLDETFQAVFMEETQTTRVRKYHISGIYQTNISTYDKLFVLADIKQIQRLNRWDKDMVSGLEIMVKDYELLDKTSEDLFFELQGQTDRLGNNFFTTSIKQQVPMIFEWLDVLDMNVIIILILMIVVAGFSMISGLLIIVLERANMIGILKTLGQSNTSIRKIFLYISAFLIVKGLFWGNVVALSICFIQKYSGIFKLDPETYFMSQVPIDLSILSFILINFGTFFVTLLILIYPSYLVAKISPAKTIRFE
ncbi:ABC transporter permease [Bacteroidia bacterium]|nr:ABC transporter permease [Bacteroidia bacterium]